MSCTARQDWCLSQDDIECGVVRFMGNIELLFMSNYEGWHFNSAVGILWANCCCCLRFHSGSYIVQFVASSYNIQSVWYRIYIFLCFVDHASRYNNVKKKQLDAQLIFSIFCQPLHVLGLDTAETCRGWWNVLRISCASNWFFFTRVSVDIWIAVQTDCNWYIWCVV